MATGIGVGLKPKFMIFDIDLDPVKLLKGFIVR